MDYFKLLPPELIKQTLYESNPEEILKLCEDKEFGKQCQEKDFWLIKASKDMNTELNDKFREFFNSYQASDKDRYIRALVYENIIIPEYALNYISKKQLLIYAIKTRNVPVINKIYNTQFSPADINIYGFNLMLRNLTAEELINVHSKFGIRYFDSYLIYEAYKDKIIDATIFKNSQISKNSLDQLQLLLDIYHGKINRLQEIQGLYMRYKIDLYIILKVCWDMDDNLFNDMLAYGNDHQKSLFNWIILMEENNSNLPLLQFEKREEIYHLEYFVEIADDPKIYDKFLPILPAAVPYIILDSDTKIFYHILKNHQNLLQLYLLGFCEDFKASILIAKLFDYPRWDMGQPPKEYERIRRKEVLPFYY